MLIKNVHVDNQQPAVDVQITDGRFSKLATKISDRPGEPVIDGQGGLLLPPFVESHIHLDTQLTAGQPRWNESGTLFEGIQIWGERRQQLTKQDVKERALATLKLLVAHGVQFVRSHVDVSDPHLVALEALLELRAELADKIDLQLVAFPQDGIVNSTGKSLVEQALKEGADVVGGIPHMEMTTEDGWQSVHDLMKLAVKYDCLVDMHCDEIDDPATRNLEVVAADAIKFEIGNQVTASHTTALGSYNGAYTAKLMGLLQRSHINIVANPLVNVHLGGRFDSYPKRRGLTRVGELTQAGVNVSFGEDDIQDFMNPLGTGNLLDSVLMGVYIDHLMGYHQVQDSYRYISYNGANTLNVSDQYGIEVGKPANCILLDAPDFYRALNERAAVRYNIRHGKVIAQTKPAETAVWL